jgi:hypothetical protein
MLLNNIIIISIINLQSYSTISISTTSSAAASIGIRVPPYHQQHHQQHHQSAFVIHHILIIIITSIIIIIPHSYSIPAKQCQHPYDKLNGCALMYFPDFHPSAFIANQELASHIHFPPISLSISLHPTRCKVSRMKPSSRGAKGIDRKGQGGGTLALHQWRVPVPGGSPGGSPGVPKGGCGGRGGRGADQLLLGLQIIARPRAPLRVQNVGI